LNNKICQYELLKDVVPIADFVITDREDALNHFDKFKTEKGVFTSLAFSCAGSGTRIHKTKQDLANYIREINDEKLILAKVVKEVKTHSLDVIIANSKEVLIFGLTDLVLNGLQCVGRTYPCTSSNIVQKKCYDLAHKVAFEIAKNGIRGYFNMDIIVDENENIFFCEINGRYGGTTPYVLLGMEQSRFSNHPSIQDLEVMAILDGTFHGHKVWNEPKELFWHKVILRSKFDGVINDLSITQDIEKIFEKRHGIGLTGQLTAGTKIIKNETVGHLVIVRESRKDLNDAIGQSKNLLNNLVEKKMQAIILAAGNGSRLRPLTEIIPKVMIEVCGETIIKRALNNLAELKKIDEVIIVIGYKAEKIKEHLGMSYRGMKITYVLNKDYASTNNIYSLLLAKDCIKNDVILLEGDVLFEKELLMPLIDSNFSNLVLVAKYNENITGTVITMDENTKKINSFIGSKNQEQKEDYFNDKYKTVNIYLFKKDFLDKHFIPGLDKHISVHGKDDYYEVVLGTLTALGVELYSHLVTGVNWYEIDDLDDLEKAAVMFSKNDGCIEYTKNVLHRGEKIESL
ncbi:MAG: NTP transferase domain-containing protein, partial [Candidatus Aenigmarchaeota archaeon]|nr:NTP transferase domain-containing protein [Candidatus Aenigmarchaeota archaeon]